jgi:glycosyltransferase involved in cell wall biosynthesis
MNILFLMKSYQIGGQETVTNVLSHKFIEEGHNVSIVCFTELSPIMQERADKRIRFYRLDNFSASKHNVTRLREILIRENTDVIINQWGLPFVPTMVAKKASRNLSIKYISVYHHKPDANARIQDATTQINHATNPLKKIFYRVKRVLFSNITKLSMRYVYWQSDEYILLSSSYVKIFKQFTGIKNAKKLKVITNPVTIDADGFVFDSTKKQKEIIYVGRIDYSQKRVHRIVELWAKLESQFPEWKLTLIGDGKERKNIEQQASELNLKNVVFEGFKNPVEYYKRASILLLTSEYEGFPLVLAECMSFGVIPVVYGSFSSVFDIIENGENGVVVMPDDNGGYSEKSMLNNLFLVLQDEQKRNFMGKNAVLSSRKFNIEQIYEKWNEFFYV